MKGVSTMRITDLLKSTAIELNVSVASKDEAIDKLIALHEKAGIPVGMCGESAADRELIPSLVKWGLDEFSVTPNSILATRKAICECE